MKNLIKINAVILITIVLLLTQGVCSNEDKNTANTAQFPNLELRSLLTTDSTNTVSSRKSFQVENTESVNASSFLNFVEAILPIDINAPLDTECRSLNDQINTLRETINPTSSAEQEMERVYLESSFTLCVALINLTFLSENGNISIEEDGDNIFFLANEEAVTSSEQRSFGLANWGFSSNLLNVEDANQVDLNSSFLAIVSLNDQTDTAIITEELINIQRQELYTGDSGRRYRITSATFADREAPINNNNIISLNADVLTETYDPETNALISHSIQSKTVHLLNDEVRVQRTNILVIPTEGTTTVYQECSFDITIDNYDAVCPEATELTIIYYDAENNVVEAPVSEQLNVQVLALESILNNVEILDVMNASIDPRDAFTELQ